MRLLRALSPSLPASRGARLQQVRATEGCAGEASAASGFPSGEWVGRWGQGAHGSHCCSLCRAPPAAPREKDEA